MALLPSAMTAFLRCSQTCWRSSHIVTDYCSVCSTDSCCSRNFVVKCFDHRLVVTLFGHSLVRKCSGLRQERLYPYCRF